jgi:hypothetical protein
MATRGVVVAVASLDNSNINVNSNPMMMLPLENSAIPTWMTLSGNFDEARWLLCLTTLEWTEWLATERLVDLAFAECVVEIRTSRTGVPSARRQTRGARRAFLNRTRADSRDDYGHVSH